MKSRYLLLIFTLLLVPFVAQAENSIAREAGYALGYAVGFAVKHWIYIAGVLLVLLGGAGYLKFYRKAKQS